MLILLSKIVAACNKTLNTIKEEIAILNHVREERDKEKAEHLTHRKRSGKVLEERQTP